MIRTILITGLDGSGKSNLFSKLKSEQPEHLVLITLPHIDTDGLTDGSATKKQALLLNQMGRQADENNLGDLKALALFGSMLLYTELVREMSTPLTRIVVCERHPLIDPLIYAKFYAERVSVRHLDADRLNQYNEAYGELLTFITGLLPVKSDGNPAKAIFKFIYGFFKDTVVPDEKMRELFKTGLPDGIYFLKANPQLLFDRIAIRKVAEPHEKLQVLTLLDKAYDDLFDTVSNKLKTPVEYIDASGFEALDRFYGRLRNELTNN